MLDIVGLQLTNLTAYNEYITDVIIAVIVYLSAFSLVIQHDGSAAGRRKTPRRHGPSAERRRQTSSRCRTTESTEPRTDARRGRRR